MNPIHEPNPDPCEDPRHPARRIMVGFLAVQWFPLLLFLDTAVAAVRGWKPPALENVSIWLWGGVGLASLYSLLASLALFTKLGRRIYNRKAPQLVLLMTACTVAVALSELVSFYTMDYWAHLHRRPENFHRVFRPRPGIMPGVAPEGHYTTNALGIRGPAMPQGDDHFRILCVGGSTTECVFLDDQKTWPHLLMERLNKESDRHKVWVGNVGISGYCTLEHLEFISRSRLMPMIDCVILMVGFNDGGVAIQRSIDLGPPPAWRRSQLAYLAAQVARRAVEPSVLERIDLTGTHIVLRRQRRQASGRTSEMPNLDQALQDYGQRIRRIAAACRGSDTRCVFLTQPVLYDASLDANAERLLWLGETKGGKFVIAAKLREGIERFNAVLRAQCKAAHVECVDLSSMSGQPAFFFDDCHFNEAGAREVSRLAGEHFRRSGW